MATLIVVSLAPPAAGQERQSPIDLRRASLSIADLPRLHFRYPAAASLGVVNTGSPDELATIRANVPPNSAPLLLGGAAYELVQFHWHAPSEHLVQGRAFPMEMHLVHQTAGGSLLVVGVFIQEGERHEELDEIFESLPTEVGDTSTVAGFDLRTLLPSSKASVRYRGSLTTPPFTEGVRWVVLVEPIELARDQIHAFVSLFPEGNARESQPLNRRVVRLDLGKPRW